MVELCGVVDIAQCGMVRDGRRREGWIVHLIPVRGGGVVVPDSTSPGFVRIWNRDGSGPRFVPSQDSPLLLT